MGFFFFFFCYDLYNINYSFTPSYNLAKGLLYSLGIRLFKNILVKIIIKITVVFNTIPSFLLYSELPPNLTLENKAKGAAPFTKPLIIKINTSYFLITNFLEHNFPKPTTINTFTVLPIIKMTNTHNAKI